jgi:RIO kinase 1
MLPNVDSDNQTLIPESTGEGDDGEAGQYVEPGRRRPRPVKAWHTHKRKVDHWEILSSLVEPGDPALARSTITLSPTLDATSEEQSWIVEHLNLFADSKTLTAVLRRVKGGKEANVYCCAAHPDTGLDLIAAKLYRARKWRNLRNDSRYRQGRPVLTAGGQAIDARDWRLHKAIAQKSAAGLEATQASWIEYEYQTMLRLVQAGVDVPRPLKHGQNVILMEYIGDEIMPAPTLSHITLERDEAHQLFQRMLRNIELMLAAQIVHGDLSAYNVLYWAGEIAIIDFPQVVDPRQNSEAGDIFRRDVERICQYFSRYGVSSQPARLARDLWARYAAAGAPVVDGR